MVDVGDIRNGFDTTEQEIVVDHVRRYYQLVDAGDIDALIELFAKNVVYCRPGYQPLFGRRQLENFYRGERVIATGKHTLFEVVVQQSQVAVNGEFTGVLKDGDEVSLRFADFFSVSDDGLFSKRETFFFTPMV